MLEKAQRGIGRGDQCSADNRLTLASAAAALGKRFGLELVI
jgi:hypothetical protein